MPTLEASFRLYDNYTKSVDKILRSTDNAERKINSASNAADKFNSSINNIGKGGTSGLDKIIGKFTKIASVAVIAKKTWDTVIGGLNTATNLQKSEQIFGGILGDLNKGSALFDHISKQARISSLNLSDMATNTQSFLGVTRDVKNLDRLNNMAERMARLNTMGQDAKGAGFSLKEVMTGDYKSLAERFNISRNQIKNSGLMEAVNTGDMTKALDILDKILDKAGYSQEALNAITKNLSTQWDMFTSNLGVDFGTAMKTVADTLVPVVMKLNELLNSGKLQPFIDAFAGGINVIAMGLSWLVNGFIMVGNAVADNWEFIYPFLVGIGVVMLPMIIGKIWATTTALWNLMYPMMANVALWMMAHSYIILLVMGIGIVIIALNQLGISFKDVFSFIGGTIGVFCTYFYNKFIFLYNVVAAFINFFGNVFNNPIASVKALFYDLMVSVLGFIENMAQGIENLLNKIPGVKVNITSSITGLKNKLADKASSIKDEAGLREFVKSKEFMSYSDGYSKGSEIGGKAYDKLSGAIGGLKNTMFGSKTKDKGYSVDDLNNLGGSFDDPLSVTNDGSKALEVDVSKQDLKYLKDVAEREYINKFSTATLAPNIQVAFGDVHETADTDKVRKHIETILKEEIAMCAEG